MQTYNPRTAITGSLMKQGGGGLFGGGMGGWRGGGMSSTSPQNSPWGAGLMQGASGSPQSGIFGGGRPPGLGGNMPYKSQDPFGGGSPFATSPANLGTLSPATAPTPPPAPPATPTPTSSLGQPAAPPPLGGLGQLGTGGTGSVGGWIPSQFQLDAGTGGGPSTYSGPAFDPQQYEQQRGSLLANARANWNPVTGVSGGLTPSPGGWSGAANYYNQNGGQREGGWDYSNVARGSDPFTDPITGRMTITN